MSTIKCNNCCKFCEERKKNLCGLDIVIDVYKHFVEEHKALGSEIKLIPQGSKNFTKDMEELLGHKLSQEWIDETINTKEGNLLRRMDNYFWIINYLKKKLQEAGIEVNYV